MQRLIGGCVDLPVGDLRCYVGEFTRPIEVLADVEGESFQVELSLPEGCPIPGGCPDLFQPGRHVGDAAGVFDDRRAGEEGERRARALPPLVSSRGDQLWRVGQAGKLLVSTGGKALMLCDINPVPPLAAPLPPPPSPPSGLRVQVGIDAAITANHHVAVRRIDRDGTAVTSRFVLAPTLSGLNTLTRRLGAYPEVLAVAEPTSMTWLPLAVALHDGGGQLALVGSRHAARLRGAISGKNKSDVIDADVLARAGEVFDLRPLVFALAGPARVASDGDPPRRRGHRRQPVSAPADLAGPVGPNPMCGTASVARCPQPRPC